MSDLGAVLLAGGRASRLDGVDKPLLRLGDRTLLDATVATARALGADPVVIVGPESVRSRGALLVREDPPLSGPAAAVAAALPVLDAPRTLLLSTDLEHPDAVVRHLHAALAGAGDGIGDGICLVDAAGRRQWLAGVYATTALRAAVAGFEAGVVGASLRSLFADLRLTEVPAPDDDLRDIDTWEDVQRARDRRESDT